MKHKRPFIFVLLFALLALPGILRAHNFHQLRIQIIDNENSLNWKLRFPLVDYVEFNNLPTRLTLIDADYNENVKAMRAKKAAAITWIKNSLLFRQLPLGTTERIINDPDHKEAKPILPDFDSDEEAEIAVEAFSPTIYPKKNVELKNFTLHFIAEVKEAYTIISHVEVTFDTPKKDTSERIAISQHFLNSGFEKKIDCTINLKKARDEKFGYPLSLPVGAIMQLDIDKPITTSEAVGHFFTEGFTHILEGPDHLAFLLSLVLIFLGFWQLLISVSLFTVAHCLTLLFAGMNWIRLPTEVVEPLIGLTVTLSGFHAWKCTSRFKKDPECSAPSYWYAIVFGFGLIHGLAFSYLFVEKMPEGKNIILWLLTFNLGIELGQILFLAAAFGLFKLLPREQPLYWPLRYICAIFLLCAGTFWFVSRL